MTTWRSCRPEASTATCRRRESLGSPLHATALEPDLEDGESLLGAARVMIVAASSLATVDDTTDAELGDRNSRWIRTRADRLRQARPMGAVLGTGDSRLRESGYLFLARSRDRADRSPPFDLGDVPLACPAAPAAQRSAANRDRQFAPLAGGVRRDSPCCSRRVRCWSCSRFGRGLGALADTSS